MLRRLLICVVASLLLLPPLASKLAAAEPVPGLAAKPPAEGPAIKVEGGYMVPYEMAIPGTKTKFQMVPIPGGTFKLGSPAGEAERSEDEGPQVEIVVEPFWMGKYEITWEEYKQYMRTYDIFKSFEQHKMRPVTDQNKVDAITAPTELYDPGFTFENGEDPRQPAVTMTQYAAKQYTKWLSGLTGQFYRLPTEAEWEYAARAGSTTPYSFGDAGKLGEYAWYYDNSDETSHEVGKKKPNPWGLYDIHGNAAEWVLDAHSKDYKHLAGKQSPVALWDAVSWPTKVWPRVVRGGSWDDDPDALRSAARLASNDDKWKQRDPNLPLSPWWFTNDPARGVGFRLVRQLAAPSKELKVKVWEPDCEELQGDIDNRLQEGRGVLGIVDTKLPAAIEELKTKE